MTAHFITEIKSLISRFEASPVAASIEAFFAPFISSLESEGKSIAIAAATNAVTIGESTPGTGEVKMAAALAAFSATVAAQGLPYVESEARALIEVALQNLKNSLGGTEVTAPATTPAV